MKISHLRYKVSDLNTAVEKWRAEGFSVELGSMYTPYNALIYFSEGPYIELYKSDPMPGFERGLMKVLGKGFAVKTLEVWDNKPVGYLGIGLEHEEESLSAFNKTIRGLKKHGLKVFVAMHNRLDIHGRMLQNYTGVPSNPNFPLIQTRFSEDHRPSNAEHPNGITGIDQISMQTDAELIPIIKSLCDDPMLNLSVGSGEISVKFRK